MTVSHISSKATGPIVIKFHVQSPGVEGDKIIQTVQARRPTRPPWLNMVKTSKIFFSETNLAIALKLEMLHWIL